MDCSLLLCQRIPCSQISQRKLSQIATKLRNSRKYSPSKVSRYTVCVQKFFHSTTDAVRVGLMLWSWRLWSGWGVRNVGKLLAPFLSTLSELGAWFQSLVMHTHPVLDVCTKQHTNKGCYCFTGWVGSLIGLHIVVSSNLSSLSFLQLHWVKKNHHLSESKSVSRFATNTTAVPTPMSRFEARWILRIGLIIIYTISVSSQVQVSSHSTMICVSIVIKEQHSQFRCCDIWPLKSLKFALSRTNMCTVPTKTYP